MNGEHEEHYQINGTALDGVHERMNEDRLEKDFIEVSKVSKPKIVSFYEAWNAGILNNKGVYQPVFGETQVTALQAYGAAWLHKAPLCQSDMHQFKDDIAWKKSDHQAWGDWMRPVENNMFFHACKIQWLVHIIQNEGLYSVPQALLKTNKWFPHPGQFRVHAIEYTDCNEEFVVWDVNQRLPQPEIDFEEWYSLYSHHNDKHLFAVVDTHKVEMHVGEERRELYDKIVESIDANKGQRPILEGTTDERLEQLFTKGTYEGHGIGIVGDFKFEDLKHIMDFDSSKQIIQKENFTLYNNYHK